MLENKYDDSVFFEKYSGMARSRQGLAAAGEWRQLKALLPPLAGKRMLDLGCGFGWHCRYAAEQGAARAVGIDLSEKMLERARQTATDPRIVYRRQSIEEASFGAGEFDLVLSSLALHYVSDYRGLCRRVYEWLTPGGVFVFSVEHPVFTAYGNQDWIYDHKGQIAHWPVDRYYEEGPRQAVFLGETMTKYHRTLETYVSALLETGFALTGLAEARPSPEQIEADPAMAQELRRPMMLLLSAQKV